MPIASVNGVRLHFVVLDPVRPARNNGNVVLVHGLGETLGCWYWKLAPELSRFNRVVMFDLRGHGLSSMPSTGYTAQVMATDVLALLDYLGVADAHFLGHSLGGRDLSTSPARIPDASKASSSPMSASNWWSPLLPPLGALPSCFLRTSRLAPLACATSLSRSSKNWRGVD